MSAISFILLISGIKKSKKLQKYNNHKGLNERMPGYQVRLGLGLHLGYAIEGAIGSYYKIDASYLSPNVRMAERLEAATKFFGVPLLISGALWKYFTRKTRDYCRQVDYCTMAGNKEPVKLFTIDVDSSQLAVEEDHKELNSKQQKIKRVSQRIKRNNLRTAAFANDLQISESFESNLDIKLMRQPYTKEFYEAYNNGFKLYVAGKWEEAKEQFDKVLEIIPADKPTKNLIDHMEQTSMQPPPNWKGHKFFAE